MKKRQNLIFAFSHTLLSGIGIITLFLLSFVLGSCSTTNYIILKEEGIGKYKQGEKTYSFKVPKEKGIKVRKQSKTCFRLFWGSRYIGILCDPDIKFFGDKIPEGTNEIDIDDFLKMEKEKGGDGNNTETQSQTQSQTQSSSRKYETGPRGGQYYINSKGNKVYKRKKK